MFRIISTYLCFGPFSSIFGPLLGEEKGGVERRERNEKRKGKKGKRRAEERKYIG